MENSGDAPPRPVGHEAIGDTLHVPVMRFALAGELEHLKQQESWRRGAGPSSTTLVKHPDLRIVLAALRRGEHMSEHRTEARFSLQVLSGKLRVRLPDRIDDLGAGELLVLDRGLAHDVDALEDSEFLLTLAWPAAAPSAGGDDAND